jgi:predicted dehydrogenase
LNRKLSIGIIGAGSFAAFAAEAFSKVEGVEISAVSDINTNAGTSLARLFNARFHKNYLHLLNNQGVDLVYIATPPFLHFKISRQALLAGKHVISEKPAALKATQAEELRALGKQRKLLYVVNLMQRYNPLYEITYDIVCAKLLGDFLHGYFENYASDENLSQDHWFWNERSSGGIFVEHGVHFFDMFCGWLGEGKVINAAQIHRPHFGKIYDRVQATVLYAKGTVNFYHGFDQPKILDRQELRLLFERGEITLSGWIPLRMQLYGLVKTSTTKRIQELLGPHLAVHKLHTRKINGKAKGRFLDIAFENELTIDCQSTVAKEDRYRQMLKDMLDDQWKWIRNKRHVRVVDDRNAVHSLQMAEHAKKIARKF